MNLTLTCKNTLASVPAFRSLLVHIVQFQAISENNNKQPTIRTPHKDKKTKKNTGKSLNNDLQKTAGEFTFDELLPQRFRFVQLPTDQTVTFVSREPFFAIEKLRQKRHRP